MDLPQPSTLADVVVDGAIAQADVDAAFAAALGRVTSVEFTTPPPLDDAPDAPVAVRIHTDAARPLDLSGTRVARVTGTAWTWLSERAGRFDIPELSGTQPASDELISAARTLFANQPVLLAPHDDEVTSTVVVVSPELPESSPRTALATGVSRLAPGQDARRALIAFAAARGLGVQVEGERIAFADGSVVTLDGARVVDIAPGPTLAEVRDDALHVSTEHQLLFDGHFPAARLEYQPGAPTALLNGQPVTAEPLALIDGENFTWAWAAPGLQGNAARRLRAFGLEAGIPAFTVPHLTHTQADSERLIDAAKPVTGLWTHASVTLETGATAIVLLDAPQLHLPPASTAAARAVLSRTHGLSDPLRAAQAWAQFRGVPTRREADGLALRLPETELHIDATGALS